MNCLPIIAAVAHTTKKSLLTEQTASKYKKIRFCDEQNQNLNPLNREIHRSNGC